MRRNNFVVFVGSSLFLIASAASAEQYLSEIVSKAPHKKAYAEMLVFPDWVSKAQGTATPVEIVSADGKDFTVGHMCKPQDCADNQLSVVFSDDGKKAWGLLATLSTDGTTFNKQFLGNPDSVVERLLNESFSANNPED